MNHHRYSFFGQKTGILLDSGKFHQDSIFLSFVKKLDNHLWEKPSQGQGKSLKFNLGEILQILKVLSHENTKWSTVHRFQTDSTPITWENKQGVVNIIIPGYRKILKFPNTQLFHDLLQHIYHEKIEFGTGLSYPAESKEKEPNASISTNILDKKNELRNDSLNSKPKINPEDWLAHLQSKDDYCLVPGELIAQREKAIAFKIANFNQIWIPKSVIANRQFSTEMGAIWIKNWFLTKKLEDIFLPVPS